MKGLRLQPGKAWGGLRSAQRCRQRICWACAAPFERAAAELLIKEYVRNGSTVATGSGKLAAVFTQCLAQSVHQGNLQGVSVLPASDAAAAEALLAGLPLAQLGEGSQADLLVYDVDCVDRSNWTCLAGRSPEGQHQPNLLRLQQVAVCSLPWSNECPSHLRGACCQIAGAAKAFVAVVERREQVVERLTGWLPVVIQSADWEPTAEEIDDMFLGVAEIWRRSLLPEADPRGGKQPYESADGHNLVDVRFYKELTDQDGEQLPYSRLADAVVAIPGVVTTGLLLGPCCPSAVLIVNPAARPELLRRL